MLLFPLSHMVKPFYHFEQHHVASKRHRIEGSLPTPKKSCPMKVSLVKLCFSEQPWQHYHHTLSPTFTPIHKTLPAPALFIRYRHVE